MVFLFSVIKVPTISTTQTQCPSFRKGTSILVLLNESKGIIHLVRMQNFPKNIHFLSPDNFFGKFCARTKLMTPRIKNINHPPIYSIIHHLSRSYYNKVLGPTLN